MPKFGSLDRFGSVTGAELAMVSLPSDSFVFCAPRLELVRLGYSLAVAPLDLQSLCMVWKAHVA